MMYVTLLGLVGHVLSYIVHWNLHRLTGRCPYVHATFSVLFTQEDSTIFANVSKNPSQDIKSCLENYKVRHNVLSYTVFRGIALMLKL